MRLLRHQWVFLHTKFSRLTAFRSKAAWNLAAPVDAMLLVFVA